MVDASPAQFHRFQPLATAALAPAIPQTQTAVSPSLAPVDASQSSNAPSPAQFQPLATAALAPAIPQTAVSPSNVPSPAQFQPLATAAKPRNASSQPLAAPAPSDALSLLSVQDNAPSQYTATSIVQPVDSSTENGISLSTPLSSLDSSHSQLAGNTETSTLSSVSSVTSSVPLNQADTALNSRRSGRNPAPSKRHDQMNEINGKAKNKTYTASARIEKENAPTTTPEWAITAHDHLLKSDLGKDWTTCVQAWFELEQELGFGSQAGAKVDLLQWSYSFRLQNN